MTKRCSASPRATVGGRQSAFRTGVRARFVLALAMPVFAAACAPRGVVDVVQARADVEMLASTIGSRPIGSPANARAREYVAGRLRDAGFDVRIQEADAVDANHGITTHVSNVIGLRQGAEDDAIALVAHFDSVPDGPGAADDALGVATCLAVARDHDVTHHSLMVVLTDGEEVGLMGARAAVAADDVRRRVKVFLNFDGTGAAGTPILFEAGPGRGAALDAWARRAPAPFGASFGVEIYRRLPNDTDFSMLKTTGASGLNFAPVIDSYGYHTDRDTAARLSTSTIERDVANSAAIVRAIDATDLSSSPSDAPTFFDLAGRRGVVYGLVVAWAITIGACLAGAIGWLLVTRDAIRARKITGLVGGWIWAMVSVAAAGGAMTGVVWALRRVRGEVTPWYASPMWTFGAMVAAAAVALWCAGRLVAPFWKKSRSASPVTAWSAALPVWMALTITLQVAAPAAAYLVAMPLVISGVLVSIWRHPIWMRLASAIVLTVVIVLWGRNVVTLLQFLVPLFGWLPVVTPVWAYPAVIVVAGLMMWPPFVAMTSGLIRSRAVVMAAGLVPLVALVVFGIVAWRVPAYTAERPARRGIRYVQDNVRGEAWWDVGGPERATGLDRSMLPDAHWQRETANAATAIRAGALALPFSFRAVTSPLIATPPATVTGTWSVEGGHGRLDVTVAPRELLAARLVLPRGLAPVASTLAGAVAGEQWTATFVAVPLSGATWTLTFASPEAAPATRLVVALILPGVPLSGLPTTTSSWQARTTVLVAPK